MTEDIADMILETLSIPFKPKLPIANQPFGVELAVLSEVIAAWPTEEEEAGLL